MGVFLGVRMKSYLLKYKIYQIDVTLIGMTLSRQNIIPGSPGQSKNPPEMEGFLWLFVQRGYMTRQDRHFLDLPAGDFLGCGCFIILN